MEYELDDEPRQRLSLLWLIILAVILWSGAWWLGRNNTDTPAPQGETTTSPTNEQ